MATHDDNMVSSTAASSTLRDATGRLGVYTGPIDEEGRPHGDDGWMLYHAPPPAAAAPPPPPSADGASPVVVVTPSAPPKQQQQHSLVKYQGSWSHGAWSGHGVIHTASGHVYTGTPKHGEWRYGTGVVYQGPVVTDQRRPGTGTGSYRWPTGPVYRGDFVEGRREGKGIYEDKAQRVTYEGDFANGRYHGDGVYTWYTSTSKHVYTGMFHNGQPHGEGRETVEDLSSNETTVRHEGLWKCGKAVSQPEASLVPDTVPPSVVAERVFSPASSKSKQRQASCAKPRDIVVVHNRLWMDMNTQTRAVYRGLWDARENQPTGNGTAEYETSTSSSSAPSEGAAYKLYEGCFEKGRFHGQGHLGLVNGDSYRGEFEHGQRHGEGRYQWADGRHYEGSFVNNDRHGRGTASYPDGSFYEGDFVNGRRHGRGRFLFGGGSLYDGEWKDGLYEGTGSMVHPDGTTYVGSFRKGFSHGNGKEVNAAGEVLYEGEWLEGKRADQVGSESDEDIVNPPCVTADESPAIPERTKIEEPQEEEEEKATAVVNEPILDAQKNSGTYTGILLVNSRKPHGVGRLVYSDGKRIHEGFWKNGMKEGHGRCLFFPQGDFHEGEYKRNLRHGPGRYQWKDGRSYAGEYMNDMRHGPGVFTYPTGERYEGEFVKGRRSGHGTFQFENGRGKYDGEWRDGKCHGMGKKIWGVGECYVGEFAEGYFHGHGRRHDANGTIIEEGSWIHGVCQGSQSQANTATPDISQVSLDESIRESSVTNKASAMLIPIVGPTDSPAIAEEHQIPPTELLKSLS